VRMLGYYRRWLSVAVTHSWGKTETVSTLAGIAVPAVAKMSGDDGAMSDLAWQVPLCVFLTLFVVRFLLAPWWIHKEQELAFTGQTSHREKTFEDTVRELKEESATRHAELLGKIGAVTAERDSYAASLGALQAERDEKRASVDDIHERLNEFAEERRRIANADFDVTAFRSWHERVRRFALVALRKQIANSFPLLPDERATSANRFRLDECRNWLSRLGGMFGPDTVNAKCTEKMLAEHPAY
jgi:hypothetical protein